MRAYYGMAKARKYRSRVAFHRRLTNGLAAAEGDEGRHTSFEFHTVSLALFRVLYADDDSKA